MPQDNSAFKAENQREWERNADFWLKNPLRQVEDTKGFFKEKLRILVKAQMAVVDMGCGSGWLLDFLLELGIPFEYLGLDFNPRFIEHLRAKYANLPFAAFELVDLEQPIPSSLHARADIVFNCFNFFETLDLTTAFANAVRMLKVHGSLVIFTIDPIYLALAVSKDMAAFRDCLHVYEVMKSRGETPHFFQNIDLGDAESLDLRYASVLYSLDDFYAKAKAHLLRLTDYGEVIKTSKFLPKTYQYIQFTQ